MEIRPVRPDEYAEAGDLVASVYATLIPDLGDYADELRDVAGRIAWGAEVWVAEVEGRVAATVTYVPGPGRYAEYPDPLGAGIRMLAVLPGYQRRGIGRALVRDCLDRARADGRRAVYLHTTEWMAEAQRLYATMAFERLPELDWEPEPGVRLLAYRYLLEQSREDS